MKTITIVYWQEDDGMWLGHLQNHPDYLTQGETLAELKDNLTDLSRKLILIKRLELELNTGCR